MSGIPIRENTEGHLSERPDLEDGTEMMRSVPDKMFMETIGKVEGNKDYIRGMEKVVTTYKDQQEALDKFVAGKDDDMKMADAE